MARLYIKGDYSKGFPYGYLELAGKMWFPEGEQKSYSNAGNNDALQKDFNLSIMLRKREVNEKWKDIIFHDGPRDSWNSHIEEWIELAFEKSVPTDYHENNGDLRILTTHLEPLTIDKRAMYIMAIEVATAIDGMISEDDKKTWVAVEEFTANHQKLLGMDFEEANEVSLQEVFHTDNVEEPLVLEEELQCQAYLAARTSQTFGFD